MVIFDRRLGSKLLFQALSLPLKLPHITKGCFTIESGTSSRCVTYLLLYIPQWLSSKMGYRLFTHELYKAKKKHVILTMNSDDIFITKTSILRNTD